MKEKRYQYWSSQGIQWTDWFPWNSDLTEPWQIKNKLKNEYR